MLEGKRLHRFALLLQNFAISRQDEMVLDPAADFLVAAPAR